MANLAQYIVCDRNIPSELIYKGLMINKMAFQFMSDIIIKSVN